MYENLLQQRLEGGITMAVVEKSIEIDAPVEKVFGYLENSESNVEWLPGMMEVKDIENTEDHVGTHFRWTYKMAGLRFHGETTVVEHLANRKIVTQTKGGISSTWTFTFEPKNGGTKLSIRVDYTVPVPVLGKLAEAIVLKQNEREAGLALANIKERIEA
jgi:carbon monoxide dehydrogenase subunit G